MRSAQDAGATAVKRGTTCAAALNEVLNGREERAQLQSRLLDGRADYFICQIMLNIPGFPKRMDGDGALIEKCAADLLEQICREPVEEVKLDNGAGLALLLLFNGGSGEAEHAKRAGIFIEENKAYGRIVDIDVVTLDGPLSRSGFYLGPRRCFLCDKDSKECAKEGGHTYEELRKQVQTVINNINHA